MKNLTLVKQLDRVIGVFTGWMCMNFARPDIATVQTSVKLHKDVEKIGKGAGMPISGVVIRCDAGNEQAVAGRVGLMAGIEVQGVVPAGKVVAVIEAETVEQEVQLVSRLHETEGVVSVQMAYHNFEDMDS